MNKKIIIGVIAVLAIFITGFTFNKLKSDDQSDVMINNEVNTKNYEHYKILVAYYSNSNTTARIAKILKDEIGANLYEIDTVKDYHESFTEISDRAKEERESGNLPTLKGTLPDISKYDVILIGGPVWSRTVSTPVMSFLSEMDFTDKTVSAFWTDIGKPGNYEKDFQNLLKNGNYKKGLEFTDANEIPLEKVKESITIWLDEILK